MITSVIPHTIRHIEKDIESRSINIDNQYPPCEECGIPLSWSSVFDTHFCLSCRKMMWNKQITLWGKIKKKLAQWKLIKIYVLDDGSARGFVVCPICFNMIRVYHINQWKTSCPTCNIALY
jgi:hypothetical protein